MKAITIKNPWAALIAVGLKDIENRTWRTNYRGRVFIHTSAAVDRRFKNGLFDGLDTIPAKVALGSKEISILFSDNTPPNSSIIGEVDIVDCVQHHRSVWAEHSTPALTIWNWVLENPVLYDEPVRNIKGQLGFWEFEKSRAV